MRLINSIFLALIFSIPYCCKPSNLSEKKLFVCYGKVSPEEIAGYKVVVIEAQHYIKEEIEVFRKNNDKVLGYLSLGEVHPSAWYFNDMEPYVFSQNKDWGGYYLQFTDTHVQSILLQVISAMMSKNLDGLFLDNLDNFSAWGTLQGQKDQMVNFIHQIKKKYPQIFLMQNRGLFALQELKGATDAVLVESLITMYNFDTKSYGYRDSASRVVLEKELKAQKKMDIPIYVLEYAESKIMKKAIEHKLNKLGYPYFIANIDLQQVPEFLN